MREYWGSQFALDKYAGTNGDTYIWLLGSLSRSARNCVAVVVDTQRGRSGGCFAIRIRVQAVS